MKQILLSDKVQTVISEKSDGNIDLRFGTKLAAQDNLSKICKALKLDPNAIVQMEQVHMAQVKRVSKSQQGKLIAKADGLVTDDPKIILMLRVADCIPVFLFDPENRAIGLVHSGWKGTAGKIVLTAIERMMLEFNSKPHNLLMALGPSIQPCCDLVKNPLQLELPEWKPFISKKDEAYAIDLPAFTVNTAIQAGIKKEKITTSKICTVMEKNLFSYKRSQDTGEPEGRFAAIIGLTS